MKLCLHSTMGKGGWFPVKARLGFEEPAIKRMGLKEELDKEEGGSRAWEGLKEKGGESQSKKDWELKSQPSRLLGLWRRRPMQSQGGRRKQWSLGGAQGLEAAGCSWGVTGRSTMT